MSAKAARSSMGLFKLWTTDSGTFPVVIICSFAAVAAGASASRYLLHNPDVCFDKSKRNSSMHYQSEDGAIGARVASGSPICTATPLISLANSIPRNARSEGTDQPLGTDRGTFPVVLLVGFAMTAAIGNGVRHLINNPDVCLTKSKRGNSMHYDEGQGVEWQAQRSRFANMDKNPVNQSTRRTSEAKAYFRVEVICGCFPYKNDWCHLFYYRYP
ncbi:NADH-ubiquinone reductase complex 1 MLRQ subunit [Phytophthora cactorum]|nr:NADH-ubiquinone reductase complex 1 MLRQ subunit [Phytophthora cactorum]